MRLPASLLQRIADTRPARAINDGQREYLRRYYLGQVLGVTFYLHHFIGDDPDRGLHDHPWGRAWTVILSGPGYREDSRYGSSSVYFGGTFTGEHFHRVRLIDGAPVWTLFAHTSARVKRWGFWRSMFGHVDEDSIFTPHEPEPEGAPWWTRAPVGRVLRQGDRKG